VQRVLDRELVQIELDAHFLELFGRGIAQRDPNEAPGLAEVEMDLLLRDVGYFPAAFVDGAIDEHRGPLERVMIPRLPAGTA
jgi:hypothetical protein